MDEQQRQRFEQAVERKARESKQASEATRDDTPVAGGIEGDQESLTSPSQPQDTFSAREKSTRHRKVTADKWNQ